MEAEIHRRQSLSSLETHAKTNYRAGAGAAAPGAWPAAAGPAGFILRPLVTYVSFGAQT